MSKTYRIKPLEWKPHGIPGLIEGFSADALRDIYTVSRRMAHGQWTGWTLRWDNFEDYGHFSEIPCDSPEHGKELAWQDWVKRIEGALEEVV